MNNPIYRFWNNQTDNYTNIDTVFWVEGSKIYWAVTAAYGSNKWAGTAEHLLASDVDMSKFEAAWTVAMTELAKQAKIANKYVYLDLEHIPSFLNNTWDYKFAVIAAKIFKEVAPELKLGCYAIPTLGLSNNENVINFDAGKLPSYEPIVKEWLEKLSPLINILDSIDIGAYMLGAGWEDRDLAYFKAMRRIWARYFPNKKFFFSVWGQYANYTPTISQDILLRYAQTVTEISGDSIICFALEQPRDDFFVRSLLRQSKERFLTRIIRQITKAFI